MKRRPNGQRLLQSKEIYWFFIEKSRDFFERAELPQDLPPIARALYTVGKGIRQTKPVISPSRRELMKTLLGMIAGIAVLAGLASAAGTDQKMPKMNTNLAATAKAIFAGGCFWCMEPPFEKLDGVQTVISGYIGGDKENPTYAEVSAGWTGHAEAVEITYDPAKIRYDQLLEVFWMNIDPTDSGGQFVDRGSQYRSAIFYLNDEQKTLAEASKERLEQSGRFGRKIVTEIVPASKFYPAEDYHQDYYKENPIRYQYYRYNSGRDEFIRSYWKKE